jgi:hypothetical protein
MRSIKGRSATTLYSSSSLPPSILTLSQVLTTEPKPPSPDYHHIHSHANPRPPSHPPRRNNKHPRRPCPRPPRPPHDKRWTLSCQDNGGGYRPVGEAQACMNFLLNKGDAACRVESSNSVFCRSGDTVITGSSVYARPGGISSTWYVISMLLLYGSTEEFEYIRGTRLTRLGKPCSRDGALGAQRVIDSCTTPQGFVAGEYLTWQFLSHYLYTLRWVVL